MSWEDIATKLLFIFIPWAIWVSWTLRAARADQHRVVENTIGMAGVVEDNSRAIRELTHFIRWSVRARTGQDAPPFTEEPRG